MYSSLWVTICVPYELSRDLLHLSTAPLELCDPSPPLQEHLNCFTI